MGISYSLPEYLYPKLEKEIGKQDATGREHMILALWDTPGRSGTPRMSFLHDSKARDPELTRNEIATRYLFAMRGEIRHWQGVKISPPEKITLAGYSIWRLDYWHPPDSGLPFNSGVVIPLKDRSILVIQINAPSQSELDAEIDSLRTLHFDANKKVE